MGEDVSSAPRSSAIGARTRSGEMTNFQEIAHPQGHDYAAGSPHLKHAGLRAAVESSLIREAERIRTRNGTCRVLEVGAGHGSFTAVLRNADADVTVTEMSQPSAAFLRLRFAGDPHVRVVDDFDGSWVSETDDRFDLVVAISVLHHIPDYLAAVSRYADITEPGGDFLSWQDPLWYARVPRQTLIASKAAYFAWRVGQGNLLRGLATRLRRLRGILDEDQVSDMSEYHVVRNGVDEEALAALVASAFSETRMIRYWSTQGGLLQRAGDRLRLESTFALVARGRLRAG
jgi:2-polyprenyl-3-methyl-5-hydroxy-6-metoxy-1,4-benzoquinol methylase